jgi:hypothetical protein
MRSFLLKKTFFCAGFFQRFFWLESITRTIVPINPTKPLVLWDNIVLKGVTAAHGALSI